MTYTQADFDEMRRCVKRELDKRMSFYPKWIAAGKMTQAKADFEIAGMKKIYEYFDYLQRNGAQNQTPITPVQKSLFDTSNFTKNKSMYDWEM